MATYSSQSNIKTFLSQMAPYSSQSNIKTFLSQMASYSSQSNIKTFLSRIPYATDSLKVLFYFFPRFPSLRKLTLAYISYSSPRVRFVLLNVANLFLFRRWCFFSSFIKLKITDIFQAAFILFFSKLEFTFTFSSLVLIHLKVTWNSKSYENKSLGKLSFYLLGKK
jgi:hypothetical protein